MLASFCGGAKNLKPSLALAISVRTHRGPSNEYSHYVQPCASGCSWEAIQFRWPRDCESMIHAVDNDYPLSRDCLAHSNYHLGVAQARWDNTGLILPGPTIMRRRVRGTRCGPASMLISCLLASLEKLGQDIRPVSHDAVHPVAKQATHVGFGVDGPDVDPKPLSVRSPDEPRRHYS